MESAFSPSAAQIALALAIIKSKPAGGDVKEYLSQIRTSIKADKSTEIFKSPDKFFDSVSFWRQAYEKSEAEQSKLQDRIFELEQRNEELTTKLRFRKEVKAEGILDVATLAVQESPKRATSSNNKPLRKRLKTQGSHTEFSTVSEIRNIRDNAISPVKDSPSTTLIRQSYTLRKTLQRRSNSAKLTQDATTLCNICGDKVFDAISVTFSKDKSERLTLTEPQMSHLRWVSDSVEFAMGLLLQALGKLSRTGSNTRETKILIYQVIHLYEVVLISLKRYCKAVSAPAAPVTPLGGDYSMQTRSKTAKHTKSTAEASSHCNIEDEGAMLLATLLNQMLTMLDLTCPEHLHLFEGFLYVLLDRAGKTLCLFVFQDMQLQPELRMDTDKLPMPTGLINAELDDKSRGGAQMDAIYLVWLLRRAMAVFNAQRSLSDSTSSESQFLTSIKKRLQSTLVQAVFGPDPEFGQTLEQPALPKDHGIESLVENQRKSGSCIPDWYIQEIWNLLGWQVLQNNL